MTADEQQIDPGKAVLAGDPQRPDGRQSARALEIGRGVARLLKQYDFATMPEMPLANGRRADIVALGEGGEIWIVEIKSSLEDFRSDNKWPEYAEFCDRFLFAVLPDFPMDVIPEDVGLIVADRYGGEIVRPAAEDKLAAARRKAMTQRFARIAARRLQALTDPDAALDGARS